jgi:hypothetical protein
MVELVWQPLIIRINECDEGTCGHLDAAISGGCGTSVGLGGRDAAMGIFIQYLRGFVCGIVIYRVNPKVTISLGQYAVESTR